MSTMEQSVGAGVYAGRIARTLNNGFTALMISIGHRTGLFDTMAALPPATSEQIASRAGLTERYVREWLAAMTSAHIVNYDARTATYFLPIEYAAVLSRGADANNLAPAARLVSLLAQVEDLVVAGFRGGGGVMPQAYERLNEVVSGEKRALIDESYVDALLELVPGMRMQLELGAQVLDAGCGDGALLLMMARMFPCSTFRGCDLSREAIARASEAAREAGLENVELFAGDLATLDQPRTYDLVLAFDTIHEQAFPYDVLRNLAASLRRDGVFVMQEIAVSSHLLPASDHPVAPMLFAWSPMHAVPVALSQDGEAPGRMWGQE
ncbi:MAG TPA: class I SAM-dependent methyltransferase, partial [Thermoanaerobaculia bacterium]|nr:class I SAM-dependent methyltransferase [Thermoanaerobaculia bacterium]